MCTACRAVAQVSPCSADPAARQYPCCCGVACDPCCLATALRKRQRHGARHVQGRRESKQRLRQDSPAAKGKRQRSLAPTRAHQRATPRTTKRASPPSRHRGSGWAGGEKLAWRIRQGCRALPKSSMPTHRSHERSSRQALSKPLPASCDTACVDQKTRSPPGHDIR